MKEILFS